MRFSALPCILDKRAWTGNKGWGPAMRTADAEARAMIAIRSLVWRGMGCRRLITWPKETTGDDQLSRLIEKGYLGSGNYWPQHDDWCASQLQMPGHTSEFYSHIAEAVDRPWQGRY